MKLQEALLEATKACNHEIEEEGGIILHNPAVPDQYEFVKLRNQNTGTEIAPVLWTADRQEYAEKIISELKLADFFESNEITSTKFAFEYLCEKLTIKFINEGLNEETNLFSEDEFDSYLKEIYVGSLLEQLREKGYITSIEVDDDEHFFLTKEGKEYTKNIKSSTEENI